MITVALIEDEIDDLALLKGYILNYANENNYEIVVDEYRSAESFFEGRKNYDMVFFDIELPGIDGLKAARRLRENDKSVTIIFVTNMNLAIKGYEVNAFDFILKPIHEHDFSLKFFRAIKHVVEHESAKLPLRIEGKDIVLKLSSILYIEVMNHRITYHTLDGDYSTYNDSLGKIATRLSGNGFALCNSCYLVNLKHVTAIDNDYVFLSEKKLPVSHGKKKAFVMSLNEYLGNSF